MPRTTGIVVVWENVGILPSRSVPSNPHESLNSSDNHNPPPSDPGFLRSLNLLVEGSTSSRLTNFSLRSSWFRPGGRRRHGSGPTDRAIDGDSPRSSPEISLRSSWFRPGGRRPDGSSPADLAVRVDSHSAHHTPLEFLRLFAPPRPGVSTPLVPAGLTRR